MVLVRPRLTDFHKIFVDQQSVSFAIPFLDEDIPLYVDPFLLWKSPSMQDTSLHTSIIAAFNWIYRLGQGALREDAKRILVELSECQEAGLGQARDKKGRRISLGKAEEILGVLDSIPDVQSQGVYHIEVIQLLVEGIGKDRISDFSCNLLKSFLIDYSIEQCRNLGIPTSLSSIGAIYNASTCKFETEQVELPINPETSTPLLLIPKRWLRFVPWINFDNFYEHACVKTAPGVIPDKSQKPILLNFNRKNYGLVTDFIETKARQAIDCLNDPLFKQIPITSARLKWSTIEKLPTGNKERADKIYENNIEQILASLFYPHLDFAQGQSRTDSGVHIRDLIFYNNRKLDFLEEIIEQFGSRQIVFELKNVEEITRDHINQLNRYLTDQFGRLGVLVTRNPVPRHIQKNLVDLWSSQRKCILVITDEDLKLMVSVFESKQRMPIEVLKRSYVEFMRKLPS